MLLGCHTKAVGRLESAHNLSVADMMIVSHAARNNGMLGNAVDWMEAALVLYHSRITADKLAVLTNQIEELKQGHDR